MKTPRCLLFTALFALPLLSAARVRADEGMWLFTSPPTEQLKAKYGFDATAPWLEHLQKSSVRFNSGGSGSFVSAEGLIITNHHVGADALQKFSDAQHNYLREGFYAKTRPEEKRCLDLELNVLMSVEDVTARVNAAVGGETGPEEALKARRAVIADIEKESNQKTGLRSDVITLYQGGAYHLYRFKRYTDVRLVFAPEQQIAFYGGDPDNFEYPRYDLDICIFRAYENGQPAKPEHFLKWSANGAAEHELVFVSGHPGSTSRLLTQAVLKDIRDRALPHTLEGIYRLESILQGYSGRSVENARRARTDLFGVQNRRKALEGRLAGLLDPEFFARLAAREAYLRARSNASEMDTMGAYANIEDAQKAIAQMAPYYDSFEGGRGSGFNSRLFRIARTLLRAADERAKPNGERLPEYRDSGLPSLELRLFSEEPIYDDLEQVELADSLTQLASAFGNPAADAAQVPSDVVLPDGSPLANPGEKVRQALGGKSPDERAAQLVLGTKLKDVALRKKLYEGGVGALKDFSDPMLDLARAMDAAGRAARKVYDEQSEKQQQAYAQIGKARFAFEGTGNYPDATFTLRLSYGTIEGYPETGKQIPAFTDFAGMYRRAQEHEGKPPFDLPARWVAAQGALKLDTPYDFVSTCDIIGGNSGSPTVNRAGEFVGIIFDGNLQSLPLEYGYSDKQARAVSTDSRAITEALSKVYGAGALAGELTGQGADGGAKP